MADPSPTINTGRGPESKGYEPTTPITVSPILDWPPRPVATLRYLFTPVMLPYGMFWIALAAVTWNYLTPSIQRMTTLHPRWMLEIYLRNALLLTPGSGHTPFVPVHPASPTAALQVQPALAQHHQPFRSCGPTRRATTCSGASSAAAQSGRHTNRSPCGHTPTNGSLQHSGTRRGSIWEC